MDVTRKKVLIATSIIGAVGATALIAGFVVSGNQFFQQAENEQREAVSTYLSRFLEDERILSQDPAFDFPGKARDAGPTLNERVAWSASAGFPQDLFPKNPSLDITRETAATLIGKDWLKTHFSTEKFDTSWMRELNQYDHWDLFASGPLNRLFAREPSQNFWSMPIPNYQPMQFWAKIRLIQALHEKDPREGFREVRQLGRLVYSNQLLIASMVYVSILNAERDAYNEAVRTHRLAADAWTPVAQEETLRAKRAMYGFSGFFDEWTDRATLAKVFDPARLHAGMCSAITERIPGLGLSRWFYSDLRAHSSSLDGRFQALDEALARADGACRLSYPFRTVWNHPELAAPWTNLNYAEAKELSFTERVRWLAMAHIPYVRAWVGAGFEAIARPNFLAGPYRNNLLPGEAPLAAN